MKKKKTYISRASLKSGAGGKSSPQLRYAGGAGTAGEAGKVHCPFCGAEYEKGMLKCPYCGSVDDHQDESEFLEDLDKIKDKLEDLPEETMKQTNRIQTKEAVTDLRRILKRVGICAGIALLLVLAALFYDRVIQGNTTAKRRQESQARYLWMQEYIPRLDELYEKGDYDGLVSLYESRQGETNWFYEWEHGDLLEGLRVLYQVRDHDIATVESSEKVFGADSRQAQEDRAVLLARELQLLHFDKQSRNKEDVETLRKLSEDVLRDLDERFALTEEEKAQFEAAAKENYGYFTIKECREFLDKR